MCHMTEILVRCVGRGVDSACPPFTNYLGILCVPVSNCRTVISKLKVVLMVSILHQ